MNKYLQRGQTFPIPIWPDLPLSPLPARRSQHIFSYITVGVVQIHLEVFEKFPVRFIIRTFFGVSQLGRSPKGMERVSRGQQNGRGRFPSFLKKNKIYPITVLQSTKCCLLCMNVRIQLQCMFRSEGHMSLQILIF